MDTIVSKSSLTNELTNQVKTYSMFIRAVRFYIGCFSGLLAKYSVHVLILNDADEPSPVGGNGLEGGKWQLNASSPSNLGHDSLDIRMLCGESPRPVCGSHDIRRSYKRLY